MAKCQFEDGVVIKPEGINELYPCIHYKDIELHTNVNVLVYQCQKCGRIETSWTRTENTEGIYYD